ncbi:(E)-4-hydroxy-3-methylbut-2-enyl-diphosphate synthase [Salinivirga cyanobacteriivorans]
MTDKFPYPLNQHKRFQTEQVHVGDVSIGGDAPVRIQSMCNTATTNVEASVKQAIEIIEAGGELVRYTVRHRKDADGLIAISKRLKAMGYDTPIVADVHFNADLAVMLAGSSIEKVRINPGNFVDKRAKFEDSKLDDEAWNIELDRLEKKFVSLIEVCKANGTALRIGTNHGSLSDRIMSRYGNTVKGMVVSTMEFLRICKKTSFENVVVSLKSSNVRVMVEAYRNLVAAMQNEEMYFPLHLGVTEAGDGVSGRVKSAAGIGALLNDGLGDTIRVSLTEDPVAEIPVAATLVNHFTNRSSTAVKVPETHGYNPLVFARRKAQGNLSINPERPAVIVDLRHVEVIDKRVIGQLGYEPTENGWRATRRAADYIFVSTTQVQDDLPDGLNLLYETSVTGKPTEQALPVLTRAEYVQLHKLMRLKEKWVYLRNEELSDEMIEILRTDQHTVIILETTHINGTADQRAFFMQMQAHRLNHPVIVKRNYIEENTELMTIKAAADSAPLFIDGFGEGIWLTNPFLPDISFIGKLDFEILQASRARTTTTEFIACPSCGRTQFDIEKVLQEVKAKTGHLYNLKIGVMGCIVNGPGEMADADYGYVGAAPGKVTLYKGKNPERKNISSANAVDELVQLIKDNGDWIAP